MSGIKYYTICDGEELPDEFAVVENVGGEPEIRAWYSKNDQLTAENAKLRELLQSAIQTMKAPDCDGCVNKWSCDENLLGECVEVTEVCEKAHELGVEVDG